MPRSELIIALHRQSFETADLNTIPLARGTITFEDGRVARFNVRLAADPGSDGDIRLVCEDINRPIGHSTRSLRLIRKP